MVESIDSIVREFPAKVKELQGVDPKSDLCKITQDLCKKILDGIPIQKEAQQQRAVQNPTPRRPARRK